MPAIPRRQYADLYGPTVGDRFRLADTVLYAEVERDLLAPAYGDEAVFGGGKTIRDGMAQSTGLTNAEGALDLVITNVVIIDPMLGHRQGRSRGQGRADRRARQGRQPGYVRMASPEAGDWRRHRGDRRRAPDRHARAASIAHIHMICPQQVYEALSNGITTIIGGGTGPADGTNATTCYARPLEHRRACCRRWTICRSTGHPREGERQPHRAADRADRGRRVRPEGSRGLGHHAGGDRLRRCAWPTSTTSRWPSTRTPSTSPASWKTPSRPSMAARSTPITPRVPAAATRRTSSRSPASRTSLPSSTNPTRPVHRQHAGRAPGHADGLPPPQSGRAGGRGVRGEPHPRRDDCRRGRAARSGRADRCTRRTRRRWAASARATPSCSRRRTR